MRKGDPFVSLHIARGADFSREHLDDVISRGFKRMQDIFVGEESPCYAACFSWLLSPALPKMLGESSKISGFSGRFTKIPIKALGTGCFGYVFPGYSCDICDLPEDTTLRRGIKRLYLDGGFVHEAGGIILKKI